MVEMESGFYERKSVSVWLFFARDLQVGDKVNCHEQGWLEVKKSKDEWMIYITYDNGTETYYSRDHRLFVIR